jgi:fluoride ion exporter CrcB/FEX
MTSSKVLILFVHGFLGTETSFSTVNRNEIMVVPTRPGSRFKEHIQYKTHGGSRSA